MQKITQKELLEKVRDNHKRVSTQARLKKKIPKRNITLEKSHGIGHTMGTDTLVNSSDLVHTTAPTNNS